VTGKTWLASNWNATAPEPAVVVTRATIHERTVPTVTNSPVKVTLPNGRVIYGEKRDGVTWIEVGETWIPLRATAELLGAKVEWLDDVRGVAVTLPTTCACCEEEK
jgi:hypothetical protein